MMGRNRKIQRGFTLVEMIIVMVITGIIGGMVAMFIRAPVQGYTDSARRAEMSDIADTALRRIGRDLRLALPNSVRVSGSNSIDFLATSGGGRYRASADPSATTAACGSASANVLDFSAADTCFEIIGSPIQFQAGDQVVIYNLGIPGADAYEGNTAATHVRRAYAGSTAAPVAFVALTSANPFPLESPEQRFQVVHEQVRYICDPATGNLTRYWGFPITTPAGTVPTGGSSALMASHVSACSFSYDADIVAQRYGLVTMNLSISEKGETIKLYSATHVSNVP